MEKLLTIVVPVYNTEKYLRKCLDSLIVPNFLDKMEILVVIDGSPDNSLSIAQEYEKKYANTFRVINKGNGGHGSCCNVGLKEARGKYIRFLDSDDWFDKENFPAYLNLLQNTNADLVQTNACLEFVYKGTTKKEYDFSKYDKKTFDAKDFNYYPFGSFVQISTSTLKTDNLRESGVVFTEKIAYDDVILYIQPLRTIGTIYFIDLVIYHYFIGRPGQSIGTISERLMNFRKHEYQKLCNSYMTYRDTLPTNQRDYADWFISKYLLNSYFNYCYSLPLKKGKKYFKDWNNYVMSLNFVKLEELKYREKYKHIPFFIVQIFYRTKALIKRLFVDKSK